MNGKNFMNDKIQRFGVVKTSLSRQLYIPQGVKLLILHFLIQKSFPVLYYHLNTIFIAGNSAFFIIESIFVKKKK